MGTTSPIPDRMSLALPAEDMQAVLAAHQVVAEKLDQHLVKLTPDQRQALPKMGPRTSDFVARAMSYVRAMPEYLPGFVDIDAFQRDLDAIVTLGELQHQIGATSAKIDDSLMLAGSEAYAAALSIYDALKSAARRGSPQAQAAAADLAGRLGPRGPGKGSPRAPEAPSPAPVTTPIAPAV